MRGLALILLTLGTAAAEDKPKPPLVITVRLCDIRDESRECLLRRSEWLRVKDEADLHALLWQELMNQKAGQVDISLRARITAICKRLAKGDY